MIRSTCVALFAVVLATTFVTSPRSSDAKDRWCQPRCFAQPVCGQPQPVCCQPRVTCCQPQPTCSQSLGSVKSGPYFCGYWKVFDFGTVCYYYAPHCDGSQFPIMLAASCGEPMNPCDDPTSAENAPFCISDGSRFRSLQSRTNVHSAARLTSKLPSGHNGPNDIHRDFEVKKVKDRMHFVRFSADLPGNPGQVIFAKVAQYDINYEESENPNHAPLRVALGHEVRGTPNNAINVVPENVSRIPGNDYAFIVSVQVPNVTEPARFQVIVATDRTN